MQIATIQEAKANLFKPIGRAERGEEIIIARGKKPVAHHPDPIRLAEPLKGEFAGVWRFRIGDDRVICDIQKKKLPKLALDSGHRSKAYK